MKTTYSVQGMPEISRNENLVNFTNSQEPLGVLGFRASETSSAQVGRQEKALRTHAIYIPCFNAGVRSQVWQSSNPFRSVDQQVKLTAKAG